MFGFLRTRLSPTAATTSAGPEVTSKVTTDVTASSQSTALVTAEVTSEVTTESTIPSSRIIRNWAEPKPYPEHDPSSPTIQIWWTTKDMPVRLPSAKQIAEELGAAMQRQPVCAGKWIPAMCIENVICPFVCHQLGWPMRPWLGRDGVASHLAKLWPDHPPRYMRTEVDGEKRTLLHYFIPLAQSATVTQLAPRRQRSG
jgi:hypothetical protein